MSILWKMSALDYTCCAVKFNNLACASRHRCFGRLLTMAFGHGTERGETGASRATSELYSTVEL